LKRLKVFFIALLLSACAGTPFNFDTARQIKVDTPEADLVASMGRPYTVLSKPNGEYVYIYSFASGFGGAKSVSYVLRDGKVTQTPVIPASF
jgi:hypothetical protein